MAGLFWALGGKWQGQAALALGLAYMFIPALVALFIQRVVYREPLRELGISFKLNRWFLAAWLLPPALAFLTLGISLLFPGVTFSPEMAGMFERYKALLTPEQVAQMKAAMARLPIHPLWFGLLQGLVAGATVNAIAGLGEELGWRGLLQKELGHLGFWRSSLLIGLIWGVWHAPLILQGHNYPAHPVLGVLWMIIFTMLFAPLISYVTRRAQSVVAAAVMHGTLNATNGLAIMVIKGGTELTVGIMGVAGFLALALADLALFVSDRSLVSPPP
jgi:membrane protease YdiL (CAAX protease family)